MNDNGMPSADDFDVPLLPINDGLRAAFRLLQRARECTQDAQAPRWDFALEIGQLYAAGLTITDLRWLVAKGFVEHADEISAHGDEHRSFTPSRGLGFLPRTCVLLTPKGAALASWILHASADTTAAGKPLAALDNAESTRRIRGGNEESRPQASLKPRWDAARRKLTLGDRLVKQFNVPAGNQELILSVFEEEDWPTHIDDPLRGEFDIDPKTRLNDTVYRLNRKQFERLLRFHASGNGSRVYWSLRDPHATCQPPSSARESHATA